MESSPSTPPTDERAALDQLERIEAVVRAAPTRRVLWRAQVMLDALLRARELAQAGQDFGEALDAVRREIQESGLPPPTAEEIDAEINAARAERASR
jgi:hypothetical protein